MADAGRPLSTEQTRLLVALVGALSAGGDALVLSSVIARLGISESEARGIFDELIDLGAISPSFAVAELDGTEGVEIPRTIGSHGKVLRLTPSETLAIDSALKRLGALDGDPLRTSILDALASPDVTEQDLDRASLQLTDPAVAPRIMQCSQALFYGSGLRFLYQGDADAAPRERAARPISLEETEGLWYLEAADAETGAHRSFRLDRMDEIVEDPDLPELAVHEEPAREVGLIFHDAAMLDLLEWPRLVRISEPDATPIEARIPY
ncbi:MAG: WYL domain-containing protein, partial [Coriobacteriaceae bacterium]|nr:WYL domain-containing protein [Coriobacteriaceae bacterium]